MASSPPSLLFWTETTPSLNSSLISSIWRLRILKDLKVFLWLIAYRSLNTEDLLQRKCRQWYISPSVCRLCLMNEETLDPIFIHCPFAAKGWSFLLDVFGIATCLPKNIDLWPEEILAGWRFSNWARILWICAAKLLFGIYGLERNVHTFVDQCHLLRFFF